MFFAHIGAIALYLTFCKVYSKCIKYYDKIDENDPFQKILFNNISDFLEKDNFFMTMFTTNFLNGVLNFYVATWLQKEIDDAVEKGKTVYIEKAKDV